MVKFSRDLQGDFLLALELCARYQDSIPRVRQKQLSSFYTQPSAAVLLANLCIDRASDTVADLACGTGTLLLAALKRKYELLGESLNPQETRILSQDLVGGEIDAQAAEFALLNFANVKNISKESAPIIHVGNSLADLTSIFPCVDVILMNPPFTRQERLGEDDFQVIKKLVSELDLGRYYESQMSLSAIFLLAADSLLDAGGKMGLVIPAATFSSRYSTSIMKFLKNRHYTVKYLIEVLGENSAFSRDCRYKEYLLVLEKEASTADTARIITLPAPPAQDTVNIIANAIRNGQNLPQNLLSYNGIISIQNLYAFPNWEMAFKRLISPDFFGIFENLPLVPFGTQEFAQIRSGFHGTYVDFLFLPNDTWEVTAADLPTSISIARRNGGDENILQIPGEFIRKAYRKPEMTQDLYATPRHFVLSIPPSAKLPISLRKGYLPEAGKLLRSAMLQKKGRGGKETGEVAADWFSHAYRNGAESSVGSLWAFEKIYPLNRANLSTFSREPVTAPNMFHLIQGPDQGGLETLHSWLNTTFSFAEYFLHAKSIRRGWLKGTIGTFKQLRVPDLTLPLFTPRKRNAAIHAIRELADDLRVEPVPITS
ncbi:MAG TPA: N-6 DNA methylase, partial [Candidatus Lokiarchaeia archaeon]|nr:N-6 DNA methylase [Candidatus Lokiarchaeia archaeon]